MARIVLKSGVLRSPLGTSGHAWLQPTATKLQPDFRRPRDRWDASAPDVHPALIRGPMYAWVRLDEEHSATYDRGFSNHERSSRLRSDADRDVYRGGASPARTRPVHFAGLRQGAVINYDFKTHRVKRRFHITGSEISRHPIIRSINYNGKIIQETSTRFAQVIV